MWTCRTQFAKVVHPLLISPINDLQQIHRIRNHMQQQRYIRQQKVLQKKMFGFCKLHLYQRAILLPFLPLFAISWRRVTESLLEVIQLMKLQHTHNQKISSSHMSKYPNPFQWILGIKRTMYSRDLISRFTTI